MTENSATVDVSDANSQSVTKAVQTAANVIQVPVSQPGTFCFAGKTVSGGADLLVSVKIIDSKVKLTVNCEKMVIGSMLLRDIKQNLSSWIEL